MSANEYVGHIKLYLDLAAGCSQMEGGVATAVNVTCRKSMLQKNPNDLQKTLRKILANKKPIDKNISHLEASPMQRRVDGVSLIRCHIRVRSQIICSSFLLILITCTMLKEDRHDLGMAIASGPQERCPLRVVAIFRWSALVEKVSN